MGIVDQMFREVWKQKLMGLLEKYLKVVFQSVEETGGLAV